jgi:hypothetical protein
MLRKCNGQSVLVHYLRWHPVVKWHTEGTAYTLRMLTSTVEGSGFTQGKMIWKVATKPRLRHRRLLRRSTTSTAAVFCDTSPEFPQ